MALTINQEPQEYSPVYNELTIRVESDQTAQTNFRFKVEVNVYNGVGYDLVYTGYFLPRPNTIEAIIDVHRIVDYCRQTLIDDFISDNTGSIEHSTYDSQPYQVIITEQYGSPRVDYATTTITKITWNASLKYQDFVGFDYQDYIPALNDTSKKWLSNAPLTQYIGSDESAQLSHFGGGDGLVRSAYEIEVKVYEEDGTLQKTFTIEVADNVLMSSCLIGTRDLEETTFLTGTKPVFDTDSSYYTIQMLDEDLNPSMELRTYTIKDACGDPIRLHFLNRLGGIDSFTFGLKHKKTVNVDRMEINRQGWLYSTAITNLQKEKGFINANINSNETIQLNCDWLKDADAVWLEELMTSPEIFLEMNDRLHSVLITNYSNYEIKTQNQDGVFNLTLDLKFAYSSSSQWA